VIAAIETATTTGAGLVLVLVLQPVLVVTAVLLYSLS